MELANRITGTKLVSACASIRKMFSLTGILSKATRESPLVFSGSIRDSLAIRVSLALVSSLPPYRRRAYRQLRRWPARSGVTAQFIWKEVAKEAGSRDQMMA